MITIERMVVGVYGVNCYILSDDISKEAYIVDPGGSAPQLAAYVKEHQLTVKGILLTHGHGDHHQGINALQELIPAEVLMHEADAYMAEDAEINLSSQIPGPDSVFKVNGFLNNGDLLTLGSNTISILHTPGHTQGCISLVLEQAVITGDTLFASGIGRTDLPGGNFDQLMHSLQEVLMALPDSLTVLPGHGGPSTIGRERLTNPYCRK